MLERSRKFVGSAMINLCNGPVSAEAKDYEKHAANDSNG
jgi:hypothetical protein